jgi:hypothetical protein
LRIVEGYVFYPSTCFDGDKCETIREEIKKLLAVGFIREVYHPKWLANPMLVKKKSSKLRMCINYTGVNKACPKDPFPMPRIDQVVASTAGCKTLCFFNTYSEYHHIVMDSDDHLATTLITPFGCFC